jgi:peptidoglycan biosynthesis protein MviN/MurJ (putative lipid II flippase)
LEKNTRPPLFFDPIPSPFLVCFEWSKNLWVCKLELYKTFWILKAMKMSKDFSSKLQIFKIFSSLNITPLFRNVVSFSFFVICSDLHGYGVPSEGLQ